MPVTQAQYMRMNRGQRRAVLARRRTRLSGAIARMAPRKKATTALIKRVLNRKLETKYVAQQIFVGGTPVKSQCTPAADAVTILPNVAIQTTNATNNVREGDEIQPIKATIRGHIWFNPRLDDIPNQEYSKILFVKMYIVQAKAVKTAGNVGSLPAGFLMNGTANPVSWVSSAEDLQSFYPVAKQNYTLLKSQTFKFVKNLGKTVGDITTTVGTASNPNFDVDRKVFSYTWKPPTLKYNVDTDLQPQNHFPMMFIVAYSPGYDLLNVANPYLDKALLYDFNTEMYFKDA